MIVKGAMARIRPDEVREIATLARLMLTDAEVERMTHDLDAILGYVAALSDLDTDSIEPMTHAVPFDCPLREDVTEPALSLEEALQNAPRREASFFQVPRIIPSPSPSPSLSPSSGSGSGASGGAGEDGLP
jgi:aspartyl-tRNA(Asn)/glutamyl-tRNA(Gln) amidotransferase subunit C